MDELKPQRRPLQFSLRKLMIWMAVWSAYLGILRCVGMWLPDLEEPRLPQAMILTIYLAVLLAVRIKWGYKRGLTIAESITAILFACFGAIAAISMFPPPDIAVILAVILASLSESLSDSSVLP